MSTLSTNYHPWIGSLQVELDALEAALLRGDAPAVELFCDTVVVIRSPRCGRF